MSSINPKKLAIYYSYPSLINGAGGNISLAAAAFSVYHLVVFGDGLESPTHPDNANTIAIIADPSMTSTQVFGYIDSTQTLDVIQGKIDQWAVMGVKGIFLDKFGYDFGLTRESQREIVWSVHSRGSGLKAFVNAFNPDDVFSPAVVPINNPSGLVTRVGPNDWYLAESFAVINGVYDDNDLDSNGIKDFQDKAIKMTAYNATYSTNMAAVATLGAATFSQDLADYSYFSAVLNSFNAWGFGEQYYSAATALLPFRTRKTFYGQRFTNSISITGGVMQHQTNIGINIDTNAHTVNVLLI
ncbi:MAG: hypothetical protein Hyperionvirus21_16 [Hyperionvirus sp.]|uniref:Uncharacterized protein n=1 Tax=Hyperionvirus sp. TaxID=2487770 RepID=A0A3G5AAY2_9VIRU|nr:MAG: hypothetical protein Hyperionvirus21_16 [Hyperionvirus sp.]